MNGWRTVAALPVQLACMAPLWIFFLLAGLLGLISFGWSNLFARGGYRAPGQQILAIAQKGVLSSAASCLAGLERVTLWADPTLSPTGL